MAVVLGAWLAGATPAGAAPTQVGTGVDPAVAVDANGMAHVVWNVSRPGGVDELHYCRVPPGATACGDERTFTPFSDQSNYDPDGPQVMVGPGGEVVLLTYRVAPFQSLVYVSHGSGAPGSFSGPTPIGNLGPEGRPAVLDAARQLVVTVSSSHSGGTFVQAAPITGGVTSAMAQLSSGQKAYDGTVIQAPDGSYSAAYADFDNVYARTLACAGGCSANQINSASNWGSEVTVTGAQEPRLASGPTGTFLLYRTNAGARQWFARQVVATGVGAPQPVSAAGAGAVNRDLFEDQAGLLHAVFPDAGTALTYRSSSDGVGWSAPDTLAPTGSPVAHPRVAASNRPGAFDGFAVWAEGTSNSAILLAPLRGGAGVGSTPTSTPPVPSGGAGGTSPKPEPVISINPNPTCTGISTTFDGSASTSPNGPITNYRWTFKQVRRQFFLALVLAGFWQAFLFEDTSAEVNIEPALEALPDAYYLPIVVPKFTVVPNWNRTVTIGDVGLDPNGSQRAFDALAVKLTVTDSTGVTGSTWMFMLPGQWYDIESRAGCPRVPVRKAHFAVGKATSVALAANGVATARVPCKASVDCFGTARLLRAATGARAARRSGVLAVNDGFAIPAGQSATVTLTPKPAGRALAKRARRPVKARLQLTSVDPLGKATTRAFPVTLKRKR
jgi:hypothetical protein